jgi:hypothetical protein
VKRQDVSGQNTLHTDGTGGAGTSVDLVGINGTAPSTGLGVADAGTLRVAISSDSPSTGNTAASATGAAVPADADYTGLNVGGTLRGATGVNPAGSVFAQQVDIASVNGVAAATVPVTVAAGSAVIGHVITDTGSTTAVTGNVTVVQPTGTNLHAVIDSGSVTATQATGTNLHVVTDATSTTIATQATGTNLHTVVDSGTLTTVSTVTAVTSITNPVIASVESGTIYNGTTALTPKFAVISASSNGNNTIVGAVALKKIRVLQWSLMASGTVNAKWQSAAGGTDKTGLYYFVANTGVSVSFAPTGLFETIAGELLNLNLSAGVAVGGSLVYVEV